MGSILYDYVMPKKETWFSTDPAVLALYRGDKWLAEGEPVAVALPRTVEEVVEVFEKARRMGLPVTTRGAGSGYAGSCMPSQGGIVLSMERFTSIRKISAKDFVAVVEAGVLTGDLHSAARRKKLFYPPDPASYDECTIGGNIATNAGGPRCLKYGVTGHYVLGLEVVLADGSVVQCGGRTHKNKTGFNLAGLFVGSEGMLGVVTQATLRLLPMPPSRAMLSAGFESMQAAANALQEFFRAGLLPAAAEIADSLTLDSARTYLPRTQQTQLPPGNAHLLIEWDGQPASVAADVATTANLLAHCKATRVDVARTESECNKLWELRKIFSTSLKVTGLHKLNEDIVVPRGCLVAFMKFARQLQKRSGFPIACFGHAGDGNIHTNILVANHDDPAVARRARKTLDELFAFVLECGGTITGEHGIGLAKLPWWEIATTPALRRLHQQVKTALDPANILNPGKFL